MNLSEELKWRGFAKQTTIKDDDALNDSPVSFYWGVDPSAPSMTIGNLAIAMMVRAFLRHGHKATLLVGGATGMIGDPDGKTQERDLKTKDEIEKNSKAIVDQYKAIFSGFSFDVVNNYDWFKDIKYLDFLRNVGKHVPMRQMVSRDFVETRLSESGDGISYAEFSYVLIQAYDFAHLNKTRGVTLQLCGSDQWGNSIAGVDLTRRLNNAEAHVWSAPLVVNKTTGVKFGKTEDGAVWLDSNLTSVYKFYQFWLNVDDQSVEDFLKIYTELDKSEVDEVMTEFNQNRGQRRAQKVLAYEVTKIVHGQNRADEVVKATEAVFGNRDFLSLSSRVRDMLAEELGEYDHQESLEQTLVVAGLATSKREARTFIHSGAIYINGYKIEAGNEFIYDKEGKNLIKGKNLVKRGKNSFAIINFK